MPASTAAPTYLVAENLRRAGFAHGFATRLGGVSEGAYASLNFGAGDLPERIAENVRRFAAAAGFDPRALRQATQVHGARVVDADAMEDDPGARVEADALVLARRGKGKGHARAVGVRVADCVPVLVATRDEGEIAAIHAGWRGVVGGVVAAGVARLKGRDRIAAIGPCIGGCCFEVGAEVVPQVLAAGAVENDPSIVVRRDGAKAYLDLRRAVRLQLVRAGVADVVDVAGCTRCDETRFFSYRRDGSESGRHLAVIALRD